MIYINQKILALCEERGWSTYMLAQKADITHSTLNSSLNRDTAPKIDTLERICAAFGITLSQFFIDDEELEVLTKEEKELVSLFRNLPREKQTALIDLINK